MRRILTVIFASICVLTTACKSSLQPFSDSGSTKAKPTGPRPTEADESVPGYMLNVAKFSFEKTAAGITISAPSGSFIGRVDDFVIRVSTLRVGALRGEEDRDWCLVVKARLLAERVPNSDGSLSLTLEDEGDGLVVLAVASSSRPSDITICATPEVTAAYIKPSENGGFKPVHIEDVDIVPDDGEALDAIDVVDEPTDDAVNGDGPE